MRGYLRFNRGDNTVRGGGWDSVNPHLSLVADDVLLPFEGLVAGVAGEEPLGAVDVLLVDLQVAAVSEDLLAGLAAIDDICFHSMVRAVRERALTGYSNNRTHGR